MSPLTFKDGAAIITVQLSLKNTGHIPAAHVLGLHKFIVRSPAPIELDAVWWECEQYRTKPLEERGSGIGIFPDQPGKLSFWVKMEPQDVKRLSTGGAPVLAGCIDYAGGNNVRRHQTRFVYEIDKKGPDGKSLIFTANGGDIPIAAHTRNNAASSAAWRFHFGSCTIAAREIDGTASLHA